MENQVKTEEFIPYIRLTLIEVLNKIQNELKAPKSQYNSFGKYAYRSVEDIQSALKPILEKYNASIFLSDEVKEILGIPFIEATARLIYNNEEISVKAQAGIQLETKGMNYAQVFGSSSSYARKYALSGLVLVDDVKDADATNTHSTENTPAPAVKKQATQTQNATIADKKMIVCSDAQVKKAIEQGNAQKLFDAIDKKFIVSVAQKDLLTKALMINDSIGQNKEVSEAQDSKVTETPAKQIEMNLDASEEKKEIGNKVITIKG